MALCSMILSKDSQEVSVFECILGGFHMDVEVESDPQRAWVRLAKSKIDALIVDYDLLGRNEFRLRVQNATRQEFGPIIIVSGTGISNIPEVAGMEFVVEKPVSVERAVHILSAARNHILKGRLRYHRETLDVPVSLTNSSDKSIGAHLLNLSQGGVKVHLQKPQKLVGTLKVNFTLPDTQLLLEAHGEVAWTDKDGNAGIRLLEMSESIQRKLQLWLERQYFQNTDGYVNRFNAQAVSNAI